MSIQAFLQPENPILYFDSGIGGIPYAVEAIKALPQESIVYLADRAGFPYGTKQPEEVKEFVYRAIDTAITKFSPKAIVIACNTATEIALHELRERHPEIPFIGTVPAIKPAAEQTNNGRIAVIATNRAISEPYLDKLAIEHASNVKLLKIGASPLVSWIENSFFASDANERLAVLEPYFKEVRDFGADMLVLGCTHFLHLYKEFITLAKPDITIIDSRNGITRRLVTILETMKLLLNAPLFDEQDTTDINTTSNLHCKQPEQQVELLNESAQKPEHSFWVTGTEPIEERYSIFAKLYGFTYKGMLS